MSAALPIAHAGHLLVAIPFFAPCLLLVGGLLVMRAVESRRDGSGSVSDK